MPLATQISSPPKPKGERQSSLGFLVGQKETKIFTEGVLVMNGEKGQSFKAVVG